MVKGLEALASMEYPGRFIVLGQTSEKRGVVVYGITGRSPSSQARKLVQRDGEEYHAIGIEVTDKEVLAKGDPNLLVYPAIMLGQFGVAVSNGAQTPDTLNAFENEAFINTVTGSLSSASQKWNYEPDKPNFTPRISGIMPYALEEIPVLGIIKKGSNDASERAYFEVPRVPNEGKLIATYDGENRNPLPSFSGSPLTVRLNDTDAKAMAQSFYDALNPDVRVAVAAVVIDNKGKYQKGIVNRHK